jgi:hypothetical protein
MRGILMIPFFHEEFLLIDETIELDCHPIISLDASWTALGIFSLPHGFIPIIGFPKL